MARVKYLIPAEIHGKVGNLVFKGRHNNPYVARSPRPQPGLIDEKSIFNQFQFKFISEFTTAVNSVKFIKDIWMNQFPDCYGSYQEIYKSNFHYFLYNDLSGKPKLSREEGFTLNNLRIELNGNLTSLKADPIDHLLEIKDGKEKYLTSAALVISRSIQSADPGEFSISCVQGANVLFTPEAAVDIKIDLVNSIINLKNNYSISQIYFIIATLDENETPIRYSETISCFLPLPTHEVVYFPVSTVNSPV